VQRFNPDQMIFVLAVAAIIFALVIYRWLFMLR